MHNYKREEILIDNIKDDKELLKEIRSIHIKASIESVNQLRKWIIEVITISSAILGAFIAISGSNPAIIKNPMVLKAAIMVKLIIIGYGILYVKNQLKNDIIGLTNQNNRYTDHMTKIIELKTKYYIENDDKYLSELAKQEDDYINYVKESEKNKVKKHDYSYEIITWLFIVAIIMIFISTIDISKISAILNVFKGAN